jgi:hypothetical protein
MFIEYPNQYWLEQFSGFDLAAFRVCGSGRRPAAAPPPEAPCADAQLFERMILSLCLARRMKCGMTTTLARAITGTTPAATLLRSVIPTSPSGRLVALVNSGASHAPCICSYPFLNNCGLPNLLLSGAKDRYAPAAKIALFAAEPKQTVILSRADHSFTGQLEPMKSALACWLKEQLR